MSAAVDAPGQHRSVVDLAIGSTAVASIESPGLTRRLRVRPFDGSPLVEPEQRGVTLSVAALDDGGFLWLEGRVVSFLVRDGASDVGVTELTLVEADNQGLLRSRTVVVTDEPITHVTSLVFPLPRAVNVAVTGNQIVFGWDSSGWCDGEASVFAIDRQSGLGDVIWRGDKSDTEPVEGLTCTCIDDAANTFEHLSRVALTPDGIIIIHGQEVQCGRHEGDDFLVIDSQREMLDRAMHDVITAGDRVLAIAGTDVVELTAGAFLPIFTVPPPTDYDYVDNSCHGVAMQDGRMIVANASELFLATP